MLIILRALQKWLVSLYPFAIILGLLDYRFHNYYWPELAELYPVMPFAFFDVITLGTIFLAIFVGMFTISIILDDRVRKQSTLSLKKTWWIWLLMLVATLSTVFTYEAVNPVIRSLPFQIIQIWLLPMASAFSLVVFCKSYQHLTRRFLLTSLITGSLFAGLIIFEFLTDILPGANTDFLGRLVWPYIDPFTNLQAENANWLAYLFAPFTLFSLVLLRRRCFKYLSLISLLLGIAILVLTQSYTGILMAAALASFFIFRTVNRKQQIIFTITGLILLTVLVATQYNTRKFQILIGNTEATNSLSRREQIYLVTADLLKESPVAGLGISNYQNLFIDRQAQLFPAAELVPDPQIPPHPHNLVLHFWTELGLFAALTMLSIYLLTGFKLIRKFREHHQYLILAYPLLHGLLDAPYSLEENSNLLWVLVFASLLLLEYQCHTPTYKKI